MLVERKILNIRTEDDARDAVLRALDGVLVDGKPVVAVCHVCLTPIELSRVRLEQGDPKAFYNKEILAVGRCPSCDGYIEQTASGLLINHVLHSGVPFVCKECGLPLTPHQDNDVVAIPPCRVCSASGRS